MSISLEGQNLKRVAEIYLVSNTPHYLFKILRRDPFVENIAEECSVQDIQHAAHEIQQHNLTESNGLLAYVLIVALSLKSDRNVVTVIRTLGDLNIRWIKVLAEIAANSIVFDTVQKIEINHRLPILRSKLESVGNTQFGDNSAAQKTIIISRK